MVHADCKHAIGAVITYCADYADVPNHAGNNNGDRPNSASSSAMSRPVGIVSGYLLNVGARPRGP